MKHLFLLLITGILASCGASQSQSDPELEQLYQALDYEIEHSSDYEHEKDARILQLRKEYDMSRDNRQRTEIINRLIREFDAYNADSALYYVGVNLSRRDVLGIPGEYTRLLIKRADIYAHAGLFSDALDIMHGISRDSLISNNLKEDYYSTYCAIYQYLSEYTNEHETTFGYEHRRALYADSLNMVIDPESFNHMVYVMTEIARCGDPDRAIEVLSGHISEYPSGSREYSILASTLAYIYHTAGDHDRYKYYLVKSAISDVQGAVKENMSFRAVATVMFEDGDIERANRYLKKSFSDANFYSALMRNAQSSKMLPVIDEAYTQSQNELNARLRLLVWVSSVLSLVLILILLLFLRQFKRLRRAHMRINRVNAELSELSGRLKDANTELQAKNTELVDLSQTLSQTNNQLAETNGELRSMSVKLKEANDELAGHNARLNEYNRTKEQYAGLFMEYCSTAISTLQRYQQSLRVLTAQGGNRATLMKKLESSEISDQLLKNFYVKFDEAILNIYPAFIDKFNSLLLPDEQVVLKPGELLNTELRLFALIRIGIDDSAKIAQFLRCSISTVYTYRSKMRKRALNPDTFESEVRNLD